MKKKIGIFVSDEGFGHFVRQKIIIKELLKNNFKITVYNKKNLHLFRKDFKKRISYSLFSNNLQTVKNLNGTLNIEKTINKFKNWSKYNLLVQNKIKKKLIKHDLIISDFVPEIFFISKKLKIPTIGICHFTLSWFYYSLIKKKDRIYNQLKFFESCSNKIFTPPFSPMGIYSNNKNNIIETSFLCNRLKYNKLRKNFCLIMDNGNGTLKNLITKNLDIFKNFSNYKFLIRTKYLSKDAQKKCLMAKNIHSLNKISDVHDAIRSSELIIARAGFNTLTEVIKYNKTAIFLDEDNNPEIQHNLNIIKKNKLGLILKINDFRKKFSYFLKKNYVIESFKKKRKLYRFDGEKKILNYIKKTI